MYSPHIGGENQGKNMENRRVSIFLGLANLPKTTDS